MKFMSIFHKFLILTFSTFSFCQSIFSQEKLDTVQLKKYEEVVDEFISVNFDSAAYYIAKGEELISGSKAEDWNIKFLLLKGKLFYKAGQIDSALIWYQSAMDRSNLIENTPLRSRALNGLGLVYHRFSRFEEAQDSYFEASELAEDNKDYVLLQSIKYNLGLVYDTQGLKREALKFMKEAIQINKDHDLDLKVLANFLSGVGGTHAELSEFDSAIVYFEESVSIGEELGLTAFLGMVYHSLGSLSLDLGKLSSAYSYYKKSEKINLLNNNKRQLSWNYQGLSAYYDHLADSTGNNTYLLKSKEYGMRLINLAKEINNSDRLLAGYLRYWDASYEYGHYKEAIEYHIKYSSLKDSIFQADQSKRLLILKEEYEAKKREQQIALQNQQIVTQEAKIAQEATLRNSLIAGSFLLVVIGGLIINRQKLSIRAKAREKELTEVKLEKTRDELELREQELLTYVISIAQKNNLLHNVKEEAKKTDDLSKANKRLKKINSEIENGYNLNQQWEEFRQRFEKIHQRFFDQLAELASDLTNTDRRICAYIKLGLSSKQISNLQNVSVESVEVRRSQIRKKLGLSKEDNLSSFIQNIS